MRVTFSHSNSKATNRKDKVSFDKKYPLEKRVDLFVTLIVINRIDVFQIAPGGAGRAVSGTSNKFHQVTFGFPDPSLLRGFADIAAR